LPFAPLQKLCVFLSETTETTETTKTKGELGKDGIFYLVLRKNEAHPSLLVRPLSSWKRQHQRQRPHQRQPQRQHQRQPQPQPRWRPPPKFSWRRWTTELCGSPRRRPRGACGAAETRPALPSWSGRQPRFLNTDLPRPKPLFFMAKGRGRGRGRGRRQGQGRIRILNLGQEW
jgi:hypothetical protein